MDYMKLKDMPNSIRCEQEIIGGIMYDPNILTEVISQTNESDFYLSSHKKIYGALCKLFGEGKEISLTMLIEEIGEGELKNIGGITYLTELITGGMRIDVGQYIKILKDKSYRRNAINQFYCAVESLYDNKTNYTEVIEQVINNLTDSAVYNKSVLQDSDLIRKSLEEIEQRVVLGGDIPGMKTGLRDFDRSVGGFYRGELNIISGRPSMGKTLFALNLSDGLGGNGYNTLLCELEMTEKSLGMRRLSYKSDVEAEKMKFGKLSEEELARIVEGASLLSQRNKVFTDCTPDASLLSIKAKAKSIKNTHGLDIVIIDHLNLMNISHKETRDIAIGEVTRGLKCMAKELDVCVILICQLSRAVEQRNNKRPMLSDLRESGNIEQDADMVMFLYRDEYYNKHTFEKGILECIIGKHRNGRIGTIKFNYDEKYQKISDLNIAT